MMNNLHSFAQVATNLLNVLQGYTKGIRFLLVMFLTLTVSAEAWGAEGIYKTALFGATYNSKSVSSYTDSWSATNDGFTVNLTNANNNSNGWNYIKMGRKNKASTGTITTSDAIDKAVTKVTLTIDAITSSKVTSITLKSSTTSNGTYTTIGTFTKSTGDQTITISSPQTNLFYKIEVVCTSGSANGLITISRVDYYANLTPAATYDVSWVVNGEEIEVTEDVNEGGKVSSLPDEPEIDCGGKVFVGWSNQELTDGNKPDVLFTTAENSPAITEATTFHAVFATMSSNQTATFDAATISGLTKTSSSLTWTHNNSGIALYLSAGQRYTSGTPNTFTVTQGTSNYCQLSAPTGTLMSKVVATLSASSYKINSVSTPWSLSTSSTTQTISSTNGSDYLKMSATSSYQIRITKLVVTYTTYSDYTTSCTTETTVSLNPNEGTGSMADVTTQNGTLTLPECTFTREGYTFAGWATSASGEVAFADEEVVSNWDADITELFAKWTAKTITITWNLNYTGATSTTSSYTYDGATITPPTPTRTGYSFNGWFTATTGGTKITEVGTTNKPTENVTYYAQWTAKTITITWNLNYTGATSTTSSYTYDGATIALPTPTRTGYSFNGWFTAATGGTKITEVGTTNKPTENVTYYAQWTAKPLTNYRTFCDVVCDAYSFHTGTGEKETWSKEAIKCFTEAEGGFEHEWQIKDYIIPVDNKFFVGNYGYFYNDNLGSGGTNGKSRSVVSDWGNMYLAPAMDENDAPGTPRLGHAKGAKGTLRIFEDSNWDNLYVGFIPDGYKLKFGDEEYTFAKTTGTEYRSDVVQYNSTNANKNVSVGVVAADGKYVVTNHTQEMRHVFLDVSKQLDGGSWSDADAKFAIYYWTNSTSAWCGFLKKVIEETHVYEGWIPADATGFKFVRYNSNQSAPGSWDNDKAWNQTGDLTFQQVQENGNLFTITDWGTGTWSTYEKYGQFAMHDNSKSKNWYVHFVPHYVLKYDKNADDATGEMDIQTVAVDADDKGVVVADCGFTRPGYEFKNWRKGNTNNYYAPNGSNTIELSADITLNAQWTPKEITITWDANGGSVDPTTSTYTYNGTPVELPTPTRANYIFNGWFTTASGGTQIADVGTTNKPTDDVTYYAQWSEKATPTFAWSAATYTAALEADNTFPTLNNQENLPVTYTSSKPNIAKIDENGIVILGAVGETEITATGAETDTHKSATTTYKLKVVESNCRWVEVTDNTTLEDGDEVVISMTLSTGTSYVLPNAEATNAVPDAIKITNTTSFANAYIWIVDKDGNNLKFESFVERNKFLTCSNADDGVRINTGANKTFVVDDTYGYLKNTQTTKPRYLGVHIDKIEWYSYALTNTGLFPQKIAGQTLKFYKRECLDSEHYWVTWDAGEGAWEDKSSKKLESYQVGAKITQPADPSREGHRFDGWTPAPTTMPAQNTTFTAKWTKVYKVTWYENGVPSYTYVPSDNAVVTWEDNIADCGDKKFYGWTADDTFVSDPTTPPTLISKGTTIAGDVTYYAVYADAVKPANPGYTKVTTISEGTYLIATDATLGKAYTGKSSTYGGCCDVTISNNDVISEKEDAVEVTVTLGTGTNAGKFAIYDGTYYLSAPNGNSITFNNNVVYDWNLTNDGYIHSNGQSTRYLQYNSSSPRFACYTGTQKYAYLYKKQTTTYKNFAVSCATYTITVTTPTGGTVTTNPANEAGAGQEITINVTPADCKYITALKYNDGSDHSINIASTPYTFIMPAADVTVTATFADKIATDIEILTSAHRLLMQGSAFIGEQVRITYNNGDKETLNWNDGRLTFTGHNTTTLGSQTVTVTYNDCGTQSASYNIEVIDGLGITFWDGDYTETIKYEPGDLVDVDSRIGQNICSGWEFAGWSETKVANESEEYVPVHNFNATDAKVLYAVYVKKKAQWTTIVTADEAKSGAKYVLAYDRYGTYYALTSSVKDVNYLAGKVITSTEGELNSFDVYYLSSEPTADLIWELVSTGENGKWYLYNKNTAKYIDLSTQGQIHLTDLPSDKLQMESGYNDSQIRIASSTVPTYYLSWDNSNTRYNTYASSNSQEYWYTKDEEFTSTPPCSPLSATFHGNGGIVTDGVNSGDDLTITEPTRDAGITTPTASFADCNGKTWTFVGWAREEIDVTRVPVLTTDLLHDGGGNKQYKIQEDGEEFWAVFSNTGNPETKYGTITFTDDDVTRQYENAKTITKSVTAMGDYNFELYHVSKASSMGIQFDNNVATKGYIKNITSLGKINSISFNDFQTGDINNVKVYVGNMPNAINTLLTEADLQKTGNTYTYYPQKNYAYVKIESNGYCGITSISIDFGKGTQIWATTPNCSDIFLSSNELYVTSTKGRAVMAPATLTVKANQLEANADVILTSNSSDVYFSTDRTFNFAAGQAANQKPKTSLTLSTDAEGNLATTDVYIHYMPSSEGDGVPADVVISANLEIPNPSISDDHTIHVRNLPAKFVIATKVGATWYALPANMTGETNPLAEVIEVDETTMTATAPNTSTYTLWPVKTTNGTGNRYTDYGDRLRFAAVNYEQRGLWANNNNNSSAIKNYAVINSLGADGTAAYEWKVTTTVVDSHWQYTLQTDQDKNQNFLRYWTSAEGTPVGPKWGTYNAGENKLYFLPVTEAQPFDYDVVEWYPTKVLIQTEAAITSPTVKVGGEKVASPKLTNKGGKLYEISNLPLETNPNKLLQVSFTADAVNYVNAKVVPIILSRGEKTITGEPFTTLTQKVYQYADVVVRDGATLTIDGGTDVANTLLGMTIYPTAKVSVKAGEKLSVHSLTFFGGIDEIYNGSTYEINKYGVPQLSLKGILNKTITNMDYIMRVDLDQMYQVGVPYDVDLYDITYWDGTTMTLGDNLYVSAYDGQKRANLESAWVWEIYWKEEEKVLKAGIGYTISADKQDAAHEYSIIRLPMKSNIASSSTEVAKTVQVFAYANENGVEITDNSKGWNFLSNPYMTAISGAEADSKLVVGRLDRDDVTEPWEWVEKDYRYVTIPSDDGTYHYQQKFKDATLLPFKSFFLQIATSGELSFALESRQNAPARYLQTNNEQREVEFEVLLANDTRSDNLGFLIGEAYTPAYEINADLEKMIGSMSVYTIYNGYNLAYNALSPTNAEEQIPIGYVVPTVGEYTWALDESSNVEDIEHIYLHDYETSVITDLLTDVYTFTASEQKSDTRFAINVTLKSKDSTVTGLVNVNKDREQSVKFIYNDKIYILHNGVIYDATGKFVETINK